MSERLRIRSKFDGMLCHRSPIHSWKGKSWRLCRVVFIVFPGSEATGPHASLTNRFHLETADDRCRPPVLLHMASSISPRVERLFFLDGMSMNEWRKQVSLRATTYF